MKKTHVLNRSMFNRGGTSAYGRGITSNLVSDEQRQRFNSGGRVGLWQAGGIGFGSPWADINPAKRDPMSFQNMWGRLNVTPQSEAVREHLITNEERDEAYDRSLLASIEDPKDYAGPEEIIEKAEVIDKNDRGDVMTDSDWMELLGPTEKQKRTTKGEAQLSLAAGALDVFSQPTIAKGMRAASPHLSKLAQTASADQKAREKAILQGKVLSKVYTDRAGAKGEADIATAEAKAKLLEKGDSPMAHYHALKSKQGLKKAMSEALDYPIQTLKKDEKTGAPIIPEGIVDETVMWDTEEGFVIIRDGKPIAVTDVDLQIFGLEK